MKLHLPKGLRAAVLAAISLTFATQTAEARKLPTLPAAAYEMLYIEAARNMDNAAEASNSNSETHVGIKGVDKVNADGLLVDDANKVLWFRKEKADALEFTNPNNPTNPHIDPNTTDWVLEIVAKDVECTYVLDETEHEPKRGVTFWQNGYVGTTESRDELYLESGLTSGLSRETLTVTPIGNIHLAVFNTSAGENMDSDQIVARLSRQWTNFDPFDIKFTFYWDADAGSPAPDGTPRGCMVFAGAYLVDNSTGAPVEIKDISTTLKGHVVWESIVLDPYFLTQNTDTEIGWTDRYSAGGFYATGPDNMTVDMKLYIPGTEKAWMVREQADIQDLYDGKYMDTTGAKDEARKLTEEDTLTFCGDAGTIYLSKGELTYNNPTLVTSDVRSGVVAKSVGFGAAKGAKLTVADHVLDSTVFTTANDGVGTGLRITGSGTVVLEISDAGAQNVLEFDSIGKRSNLELKSSSHVNVRLMEGGVGELTTITRNADSGKGDLTVTMVVDEDPTTSMTFKSLSNQNGGITVIGGDRVEGGTNRLDLQTLDAAGDLNLRIKTSVAGDINAAGNMSVEENSKAANVSVGGAFTMQGEGSKLTTSKLTVGEGISLTAGNSLAATEIAAAQVGLQTNADLSDSITANSLQADRISIEVASVDVEGNVLLDEEGAPVVAGMSITRQPLAREAAAPAGTPLLSGSVRLTKDGVSASQLAAGCTVSFDSDSLASVNVGKVEDMTLTVGGTTVLSQADSSAAMTMDANSVATAGDVVTEQLTLPKGYSVKAGKITSANGVNAGGATFTGETTMTKAEISGTSMTAAAISTGTAQLADNYELNRAVLTADSVTVGNNVALNQVTLKSDKIITKGKVSISGFTILGGKSFAGAGSDAFTVGASLDSLGMTGNLNGGDISLKHITVNGANLVFSDDPGKSATYTLLTANGGDIDYKWTSQTGKDVLLPYLPSYVLIDDVWVENKQLKLKGHKDQNFIETELTDNATRKAALKALKEATPAAKDSSLKGIIEHLGQVNLYSMDELRDVLTAVAGASTAALADSQRRGIQDVQKGLRNRIIQMGGGTNAGLTTDWKYAGIQAWAQADGSFTSSNTKDGDPGYDFNTWGATVGANLDLTANTVVGMSFSASYGELDVDSPDRASGNNDAYYLNLFARHQKERWVQMLIFTYGTNDIDLERTVQSYKGKGSTNGTSFSAYYEIGYTYGLNYEFTHILQPMVSVSLTSAKVDGYVEKGSIGDAALTYDGDSYVYGSVGIGARYQGVLYKTVHERNAVVEARALVTQDFGDTTDEAMVAVGDGEQFKVYGADTTGTGFELGVGISLPVEQHTTLYADADATFRADYTGFRANLGVRYDF